LEVAQDLPMPSAVIVLLPRNSQCFRVTTSLRPSYANVSNARYLSAPVAVVWCLLPNKLHMIPIKIRITSPTLTGRISVPGTALRMQLRIIRLLLHRSMLDGALQVMSRVLELDHRSHPLQRCQRQRQTSLEDHLAHHGRLQTTTRHQQRLHQLFLVVSPENHLRIRASQTIHPSQPSPMSQKSVNV
jgi:hypothetical protein